MKFTLLTILPLRRLVAALILTVLVTLSVSSNCHAVGPRDEGLHTTTAAPLTTTGHADTPCCPLDGHDHTDVDHCASCLHCACNAPLPLITTTLTYCPTISSLNHIDRFTHLPDVHLPIFIPPQNLV